MNVCIVYGSETGNTEKAAREIAKNLEALGSITVASIADVALPDLLQYDAILLGASTWGMGELPNDWHGKSDFSGVSLIGKKVALFGTGDQVTFDSSFVDSIGVLGTAAEKAGAEIVGTWPAEGYEHSASAAQRGDRFLGLALDEDNQPELTEARIEQWAEQIKREMA